MSSRYKRLIGTALLGLLAVVSAVAWSRAQANQTPPRTRAVIWHQIGSFSGHGSSQTESFTSDTGTLRVTWEASAASASPPAAPFRLTAHSAISGRPLQPVVEYTGAGSGIGYVQQDPHVFYMVVDAKDMNWKFTVEEAVAYQ